MNKKFLSALFLGSIVMAGGTFTACSDYDDDINKLNERVDAVEQAIADLEAAIKAGSTITSVTPTDNGVIVNLSNGTSFELTNGKDGQSGTTGSVITIGANGNWFIDGVDTGKPSRGEAGAPGADGQDGQDGVSGKYYIPGEDGYWIEVTPNADGTETKVTTSMSWAIDGIVTAAWDSANGYLYLDNVAGQTGVMVISLTDDLKSLVFVPQFYYEGIEAMEAPTFNYNALTKKAVNANDDFKTDAPSLVIPDAATSVTPNLYAEYHMNPTSANWNNIEELTYIADDKKYVTRAAGDVVVATPYWWEGEDGILKVKAHLTDGTIKDLSTGDKVTVLALQANYSTTAGQDTIITSDYAAVKAENYDIEELAFAKMTDTKTDRAYHQDHLFATAAAAIADNMYAYNIVFDSEGVDLDDLVMAHVTDEAGTIWEWIDDPNTANTHDLGSFPEDYGFEFSYELVGYHVGNNATSESAHAVINDENVLKPCMPVNGQQPTNFDNVEQNEASNGREPLVRVTLTDTTSGKIAAVGYMKFHITDKPVTDEVINAFEFTFTDVYTVDCTTNNEEHRLRWHQVEEEIFAVLYEQEGISKQEFHNEFTLDGGTADATQYNNTTVTATPATKYGVVSQTTGDPGHEETEVLVWNWQNNNAYSWFNTAGNTSKSVIVRYTRTLSSGVHEYVYVTLTWTPSQINTKPAGEISDNDKISNYWYDKNSGVPGSGYSDIHANVETVGETGANDEFKSDILNTFVGNDVTVTGVDPVYTAFQDLSLTKEFFFADPTGNSDLTPVKGNSGTEYNIIVDATGKTLQAYKVGDPIWTAQDVVTINNSTLEYFGQNDPTYAYARDILNYADHKELGVKETFTALIYVKAENCDWVPFELENNEFYAKFLRPITVIDPHETNFVDATTGGAEADLVLDFVDWRDHDFDDPVATNGHNYYAYYNVQQIICYPNDIKTDMNGTPGVFNEYLRNITNRVQFQYFAPTTAQIQGTPHDFGTLRYENNGLTVGDFQIEVPFDVVYDWGTIRVYVVCKIQQTEAN